MLCYTGINQRTSPFASKTGCGLLWRPLTSSPPCWFSSPSSTLSTFSPHMTAPLEFNCSINRTFYRQTYACVPFNLNECIPVDSVLSASLRLSTSNVRPTITVMNPGSDSFFFLSFPVTATETKSEIWAVHFSSNDGGGNQNFFSHLGSRIVLIFK